MTKDILAFERFTMILEWLLSVRQRRIEIVNMVLIHVGLHDQQRLGDTYGASEAHQMLAELAENLRLACRKSDLVARDGTDFWVLIPYEVPATVAERVATLVEMAAENGLNIVGRDIGYYALTPAEGKHGENFTSATAFLAHLKAHPQTAYRWHHAEAAR